ncbi:hypothetical protein DBB_23480 [Desulfoluna spongiiphila]|nr:hypothetical protein DBB_23480 [Desulfoluna spongiiphila]
MKGDSQEIGNRNVAYTYVAAILVTMRDIGQLSDRCFRTTALALYAMDSHGPSA